jgi:hypothetical protein
MKRITSWLTMAALVVCAVCLVVQSFQEETFQIIQQPVVGEAVGGPRMQVVDGNLDPKGDYQEISLDTTTVQELTVPTGANLVWLQAGGNNIRYRMDDADPTTSTGFVLYAGDYVFPPVILRKMRFLAESGTATLRAQPLGL